MRPGERGAVLLEILVALTLLVVSGASVVSLLSASLRSEAALAGREETLREADRILAGLALLTRTDLDRRLGSRRTGRFVAEVRRPEPTLYRIALRETESASSELLVTLVHRPHEAAR
jgi:type II secretory pathway component PulJ